MHKPQILIAALGLALAPAVAPSVAAADSIDSQSFVTIIVQAGQGGTFPVQIPTTAGSAPYALTGGTYTTATHEVSMQFGQGAGILVRLPG